MKTKIPLFTINLILLVSLLFGCKTIDDSSSKINDNSSSPENPETSHHYSLNEYSSLLKVNFDSVNEDTVVLFGDVLKRNCLLVDVVVVYDYFDNILQNTIITIPVFTTYFANGDTNCPVVLTDEIKSLFRNMDESYLYISAIIPGNKYVNTYQFDDGTFYVPGFDMPNYPFNLFFYEDFIYMIDDYLSEDKITNLLYENDIRESNKTNWDTEYFVNGKSREMVEKEIDREVEYAKSKADWRKYEN